MANSPAVVPGAERSCTKWVGRFVHRGNRMNGRGRLCNVCTPTVLDSRATEAIRRRPSFLVTTARLIASYGSIQTIPSESPPPTAIYSGDPEPAARFMRTRDCDPRCSYTGVRAECTALEARRTPRRPTQLFRRALPAGHRPASRVATASRWRRKSLTFYSFGGPTLDLPGRSGESMEVVDSRSCRERRGRRGPCRGALFRRESFEAGRGRARASVAGLVLMPGARVGAPCLERGSGP